MGAESRFPRKADDAYDTPVQALAPLVAHLPAAPTLYAEPCAGAGQLVAGLAQAWPQGACVLASDLVPRAPGVVALDALHLRPDARRGLDLIITNPPWPHPGQRGDPALSILAHLATIAPTWALLPVVFGCNDYFARIEGICAKIVTVGRLSWEGNGVGGKKDCAWYLFDPRHIGQPRFFGKRRG